MPDGMTFDVKATAEAEADKTKAKVTSTDPTILSLEDIMALDDDFDLGLEEEENVEESQESELKVA